MITSNKNNSSDEAAHHVLVLLGAAGCGAGASWLIPPCIISCNKKNRLFGNFRQIILVCKYTTSLSDNTGMNPIVGSYFAISIARAARA
jgi:hypothetical protein